MRARLIREIDLKTGITILERYREDGRLHRDPNEGPAYVARALDDGKVYRERYYWHGRLHREGGPAFVEYDGRHVAILERYYWHGLLHRDPKEGPAVIERQWESGIFIREAYGLYGKVYRDPAEGPCAVQRQESGSVEIEIYSEPGERPPTRRSRARLKLAP